MEVYGNSRATQCMCVAVAFARMSGLSERPRPDQYNFAGDVTVPHDDPGERDMNPLDSIVGTIITGVVLAVVLAFIIKSLAGA